MARRKVDKKDKGSEVKADDGISEETIGDGANVEGSAGVFSEEEIDTTLVDCKMEAGLVIDRLLSQGRSLSCGEDKLNSDETSTEQTSNQLADSCTTSSILVPYKREPDPQYSIPDQSMLRRQSIPTASSLGLRPPASMTEATVTTTNFEPQRYPQAMNRHSSQLHVPSGQHGNVMNSPYWGQNQNQSYNMPSAAAFRQHGDRYSNTYLRQSQYRNSYLLHGSAHGSAHRSAHRSAYGFGMSSANAANSRFSRNHSPSMQHQGGNSNVRRAQGEDISRYIPPHRRLSSFGDRQQEQEPYRWTGSDPSGNSYKRRQRRLGPRDTRVIKINQLGTAMTFFLVFKRLAIIFLLSLLCIATIGFFLLFLSP